MTESENNTKQEKDIPITGRFDQYRSSYWAAAVAVLGVRYAPRPFLRGQWDNPSATHFQKNKYAGFAGAVMQGVTAFYANRTWHDMKNIFAQTLAWEFDKKPEDVSFRDFRNSQNTIIQQTMENYIRYNVRRILINSTFFIPFLLQPFFKNKSWFKNMHAETGVDLGMGANAAYLFSDVVSRRVTPFEEIQAFIDRKINQSDHYTDEILATELLDIYERHAAGGGVIPSFLVKRGTNEWHKVMQVFERMADLMNQTHKNTIPHEKADFHFSKFLYLVGNGMIRPDHMDHSLAYIEIANKHGIGAVKRVQQEINNGMLLDKVLQEYKIELPKLEIKYEPLPSTVLNEGITVARPVFDNQLKSNIKSNAELAFQNKIRQQNDLPSEGLSV